MNKWSVGKWYTLMCLFAFGGIISLFQINSYWADQHHFNGVAGWLGLGILGLLIAAYCLYRAYQIGSSPKD